MAAKLLSINAIRRVFFGQWKTQDIDNAYIYFSKEFQGKNTIQKEILNIR